MSAIQDNSGAHMPNTIWQAYDSYSLPTDPKQNDRATVVNLFNFKRPHMRAFYVATFSFFIAFMAWFSLAPLMTEIKKELKLSKDEVNNANIAAVSASVISRFAIGPLADTWGPRYTMIGLMILGSIPVFCSATIHDANSLAIVRFFIGFLGGTFVCTQAWTSQMFAKEVVGTANGLAGGWGNLGGGVTHIFMIGIYSLFKSGMSDKDARKYCFTVPAALCLLCALFSFTLAEDSPKGNFSELVKHGALVRKSSSKSQSKAAANYNTWLLGLCYAATFGTELVVFNIASSYFHDKYGIKIEKAALIAALFGLMNLITRPCGGLISDMLNKAFGSGTSGMRGRVLAIAVCLLWEGVFLCIMSRQDKLGVTIVLLVLFAIGGQAGNGAIYSVVPYVEPSCTGSVAGIVGAMGNTGAIAWSLLFRFGPKLPADSFYVLGYICIGIAAVIPVIRIRGYSSLLTKARGEPASVSTF